MAYEIATGVVAARPIAAVRRQVAVGGVGTAWQPALDMVWALVRRQAGLRTGGHNIFVYHHPVRPGAPMEVDFGVEVAVALCSPTRRPDKSPGRCTSGRTTGSATPNAAIEAWCRAHGRPLGGVSWEIYGDPTDDHADPEVEVFYLLA